MPDIKTIGLFLAGVFLFRLGEELLANGAPSASINALADMIITPEVAA